MRSFPALPLLVVALLIAGSAGGAVGQESPTATPSGNSASSSGVTIAVQLEPDGDAQLNVSARFALSSANDTEAFEGLAEDFRNGDTSFGDVAIFETAASEAATQTSREMTIENVERTASVGNQTGVLSLSFSWSNFSRASSGRLSVGDVFATESGTWLPRLTADQTLVVSPPSGYSIQSTQWPLVNRSIVIDGPQTFERGEPSVTYVGEPTTTTGPGGLDGELPLLLVLLLSAALAGVYVWTRHQDSDPFGGLLSGETDAETAEPVEEVVEKPTVETEPDEPTEDESEIVDPALLSDEERVIRLLEDNGGRMKQATIVKETGWSNAKVSQLLSAMAEDELVNKLRIGRENLISLPDEEFREFE